MTEGTAHQAEGADSATREFDMSLLTNARAARANTAGAEAIGTLTRLSLGTGIVKFWKGDPKRFPIREEERMGVRVTITAADTQVEGLLVIERLLAMAVVNCMIGEDRDTLISTFEDLQRSVLAEALGGVASAVQEALSAQLARPVQISVMPGVLERAELLLSSSSCVYAGVEVLEGNNRIGHLAMVVDESALAAQIEAAQPPKAQASSAPQSFPSTSFPQLGTRDLGSSDTSQNLGLLLDVPMQLVAVLGRRSMKLREVLQMASGSVLELDKIAGEPLELLVNGKLIGYGEVIVADDKFGIKVRDVVNQEDRLRSARL
ncbi:MAG: flagellar motor switch protein FliN [Proteobacteria bacterium]|nr:flagellar motor switch protein FliN [Pseudomonadota bacterium]